MGTSKLDGTLILQARMGSVRLPGKSALILSGRPILDVLMQRLEALPCTKWLATSKSAEDDILAEIGKVRGWQILRGSSENVLSRFEEILANSGSSYCLRVTGDNPLVCPKGLSAMIKDFTNADPEIDYMSDFDFGLFPTGAFAEIFSVPKFLSTIKDIPESQPWHFSHVTSWMRKTSRISSLRLPAEFEQRPNWRWTIDYPEDFEFISQLTKTLGDSWMNLTYPQIIEVLDKSLALTKINSGIVQKSIEEG